MSVIITNHFKAKGSLDASCVKIKDMVQNEKQLLKQHYEDDWKLGKFILSLPRGATILREGKDESVQFCKPIKFKPSKSWQSFDLWAVLPLGSMNKNKSNAIKIKIHQNHGDDSNVFFNLSLYGFVF